MTCESLSANPQSIIHFSLTWDDFGFIWIPHKTESCFKVVSKWEKCMLVGAMPFLTHGNESFSACLPKPAGSCMCWNIYPRTPEGSWLQPQTVPAPAEQTRNVLSWMKYKIGGELLNEWDNKANTKFCSHLGTCSYTAERKHLVIQAALAATLLPLLRWLSRRAATWLVGTGADLQYSK